MASGRSNDGTRRSEVGKGGRDARDDREDENDLPKSDQETINLVKRVKHELKTILESNKPITAEEVEVATYNGRCALQEDGYNIEQWKRDSSIKTLKSADKLICQSMAYATTPEQAVPILEKKQQEMKDIPSNSLENIIQPLFDLSEELKRRKPKNLVAAVLEIDQDRIDSADRMFFVEARRLHSEPDKYTLAIAHDQVQAIRLMHYEIEDEEQLRTFIESCTSFNPAYTHIQKLAKARVNERPGNAIASDPSSTSNTHSYKGSIIKNNQTDNNDRNYNNSSSSKSDLLYNSAAYANPQESPKVHSKHPDYTSDEDDNHSLGRGDSHRNPKKQ